MSSNQVLRVIALSFRTTAKDLVVISFLCDNKMIRRVFVCVFSDRILLIMRFLSWWKYLSILLHQSWDAGSLIAWGSKRRRCWASSNACSPSDLLKAWTLARRSLTFLMAFDWFFLSRLTHADSLSWFDILISGSKWILLRGIWALSAAFLGLQDLSNTVFVGRWALQTVLSLSLQHRFWLHCLSFKIILFKFRTLTASIPTLIKISSSFRVF